MMTEGLHGLSLHRPHSPGAAHERTEIVPPTPVTSIGCSCACELGLSVLSSLHVKGSFS